MQRFLDVIHPDDDATLSKALSDAQNALLLRETALEDAVGRLLRIRTEIASFNRKQHDLALRKSDLLLQEHSELSSQLDGILAQARAIRLHHDSPESNPRFTGTKPPSKAKAVLSAKALRTQATPQAPLQKSSKKSTDILPSKPAPRDAAQTRRTHEKSIIAAPKEEYRDSKHQFEGSHSAIHPLDALLHQAEALVQESRSQAAKQTRPTTTPFVGLDAEYLILQRLQQQETQKQTTSPLETPTLPFDAVTAAREMLDQCMQEFAEFTTARDVHVSKSLSLEDQEHVIRLWYICNKVRDKLIGKP